MTRIYQRPESSNWWLDTFENGRRVRRSLGTSNRAKAERLAATAGATTKYKPKPRKVAFGIDAQAFTRSIGAQVQDAMARAEVSQREAITQSFEKLAKALRKRRLRERADVRSKRGR